MSDESEIHEPKSKGIPSWVYIAGGAGLLLMLLLKGNNQQSQTETDNLVLAEVDAMLKAHREEETQQWDNFKDQIAELMAQRYGTEPPSQPTSTIPGVGVVKADLSDMDRPQGSEGWPVIPPQISGNMNDNYLMGFSLKKAK